jgi:hypothetical protein
MSSLHHMSGIGASNNSNMGVSTMDGYMALKANILGNQGNRRMYSYDTTAEQQQRE